MYMHFRIPLLFYYLWYTYFKQFNVLCSPLPVKIYLSEGILISPLSGYWNSFCLLSLSKLGKVRLIVTLFAVFSVLGEL